MKEAILAGKTYLGIELGSTRIKAVLINQDHNVVASGDYTWENLLEEGYWTYHIEDVWTGIQTAYADLKANVKATYDVELTKLGGLGVSAMMHGYVVLDKDDKLLTPFRTWRNTYTGQAAKSLTDLFQFNIPLRWSISHLYQSMLDGAEHVGKIDYLTTLAGYVHYCLTGEKNLGVGDASGMFPIDETTGTYNQAMVNQFDELAKEQPWKLLDILPKVLSAGKLAGELTEKGAKLLDVTGTLEPGVPMAPPEGDAGTGMVATNAVAVRSGNVSAGTSVFAMVVLEKSLSKLYEEIDMVTTPDGMPVAMVHCNNCTNEINAWAKVFAGFLKALGQEPDMNQVFSSMFQSAMDGAPDAGGLSLYNFLSGEPIVGLELGCPMLVRTATGNLDFANFMRAQMYSAVASLNLGMQILKDENVAIDRLLGHGGYFKTPKVGQQMMATACDCDVSVMETASEGGPWGMAVLTAYLVEQNGKTLPEYLESQVFAGQKVTTVSPADQEGFSLFMENYKTGLVAQKAAVDAYYGEG